MVQTLKDQAMFNGRGNLKLWRFSNVELGPEFAAKFRFYSVGQSHRSETLLSNCIGKNKPAFDIRIDTDILEIVFTVKTVDSPETTMRMFYQVKCCCPPCYMHLVEYILYVALLYIQFVRYI